jgi:glycosyltransferase involved in cell wall biosynthesis
MKLIFINSHPIQYFAPLYQKLEIDNLDFEVWYCSNEGATVFYDKQFKTHFKWDIPLLKGYNYTIFKNYSIYPSISKGFWGLVNFGILKSLFLIPRSIIIIHGWNYFTHFTTVIIAKLLGHKVIIRGETPYCHEQLLPPHKVFFKSILLKNFLFKFVDLFLYIGKENLKYYISNNISSNKLVFCPYCVDNFRFQNSSLELLQHNKLIKSKLGVPLNNKVILYVGKLIPKKRPMDLLEAFRFLNKDSNYSLIFVGDGNLKEEILNYINFFSLKNVFIEGFKNQTEITNYYSIANVFVLPSGIGETWGLSANEAMNFGIPIILSNLVGSSSDLINDDTGFIYNCGNVSDLADKLRIVLERPIKRESIIKKINDYSFDIISDSLKAIKAKY